MIRPRTRWIGLAAAVLVAAVVIVIVTPRADAAKAKVDPRTYDVRKKAFGKPFKGWVEEWWEWFHSIPAPVHPMLDDSGQYVEVGQRGPVWFLGGVFNVSGVVERTATIPSGKALFFPVQNGSWDNEGVVPPLSTEELLASVSRDANKIDAASLQVVLDDSAIEGVARNRLAVGPFRVHMPADSIGARLAMGAYYARGIYSPFVTDGYYVMLKPLAVGQHTVRIRAGGDTFIIDVTYHLTVVDHNQP